MGTQACSGCHKEIAIAQSQTRMAQTWQGSTAALLPRNFEEHAEQAGARYGVKRTSTGFAFSVGMPGQSPVQLPVEAIVGGTRHGFSFLARISEIAGVKLERSALIETRYLHDSPHNRLELSPGFPAEKPSSYELALGRALTPEFEQKCLACHGQPQADTFNKGGVHCESCHGPGKAHLESVARNQPRAGINKDAASCAPCHSGFGPVSDPMPEDLLISSQVNAIQQSECWLQSAGALNCIQCHDPHRDSKEVAARSNQTCTHCHAAESSTQDRCLECHMPVERRGSFEMLDHWIRVHPERAGKSPHSVTPRSKFQPIHEYLRMIAVDDRATAETLRARTLKGEPFFDMARDNSTDATAAGGGSLGDMQLAQLSGPLRAAAQTLRPGDISPVVENNGKKIVLQRLPRDFRWQANLIFEEGARLKAEHKLPEAAQKFVEALQIYPQFLRALIFLGTTFGEQGNAARAAGVLEYSARLYPNDAAAQYNLGIAYDALGRPLDAVRAYRRAIEIEPGLTPAYQNLGADLVAGSQLTQAAEIFQQGLRENPLSAILYYNLSLVRERQNDAAGARQALEVATKIDPSVAHKAGQ